MRRRAVAAGALRPIRPIRICLGLLGLWLFAVSSHADDGARRNVFNDPFVQVTAGLAACPVPDAPGVTEQEARDSAHDRSQRGVSCWLAGRCRLANAYLYDAEIIPRVQQALRYSGRFADTSIWATGQRRLVWLQGCVASAEKAMDAEQLVRRIDDVEGVVNQLMIGTGGTPAYRVAPGRAEVLK